MPTPPVCWSPFHRRRMAIRTPRRRRPEPVIRIIFIIDIDARRHEMLRPPRHAGDKPLPHYAIAAYHVRFHFTISANNLHNVLPYFSRHAITAIITINTLIIILYRHDAAPYLPFTMPHTVISEEHLKCLFNFAHCRPRTTYAGHATYLANVIRPATPG